VEVAVPLRILSAPSIVLGLALCLLATVFAAPTDPVVDWVRLNARPFATTEPRANHADLAALRAIVGDAHIVALGECTHGTHECFQMKHRITEYLASEMGFHLFAIEANMPEAYRVNDYVLTGRGDPKALIRGMYFWTWSTEEVLTMVEWMRKLNASGRGRIQFLGFDMQTPDTAAAIVRRFVARADPSYLGAVDSSWSMVTRAHGAAGFDTATGAFPVADAAGHHIEYSGLIRTRAVTGFAGLWWRGNTKEQKVAAFSNMADQSIRGTRDWARYSLALDVPANTASINFGMLLSGKGTAWFDSLAITIDGKPWTEQGGLDLTLEDPEGPTGFGRGWGSGYGYGIAMDDSVAAVGKRSLKITSVDWPDSLGPPVDYGVARVAAQRVVEHLTADSAQLARASSPAEVDWATQNARIVEQAMDVIPRQGWDYSLKRDSCMALNVDWILAHAPRGEKIVLWAHNSHSSRQHGYMGDHLAQRHGSDYVVLGFTTARGHYRAEGGSGGYELTPAPAGSLENVLSRTGMPRFLLDLRAKPTTTGVKDWFDAERPMRAIGTSATRNQFRLFRVAHDFDAIVWVDSTTSSVLLPEK
jgi:erythromycin esterase-like protein